ncbi:hypothetical protein HW932_08870 [Allochromatium humboldtianum]|uniref:Uncharacterized protein n=1 Tax=Allochromatium humboldtianum TaxID=504901 RepID=A0A850RK43_9GAMM|nr:hypothetical protein [Allochromatium humboldtianum]NVZ09373.1 hypothetical protein [Allochromatium humboldtianum]
MRLNPHAIMSGPLALALLLTSTTPEAASPSASLSVERSSSNRFTVGFVQVDPDATASTLTVRGTVRPRIPARGAIPGQVHITVLDADGRALAETDASLMRRNRQAQSAHFHAQLAIDPPPGSRVRVEHRLDRP